jgi:hypothetical protein
MVAKSEKSALDGEKQFFLGWVNTNPSSAVAARFKNFYFFSCRFRTGIARF